VKSFYKIKGPIAELALMKMLYDAFYSNEFDNQAILSMFKSVYFTSNPSPEIKQFATIIAEKIGFLMPGSEAPIICLKDLEGNDKCTDSFSDKYKYLIFADAEMVICREQLKYLASFEQKYSKHLLSVVVFRKADLAKIRHLASDLKLMGIMLVDTDDKTIEKYKVKAFPSSFLINEKHQIVFSQTKNPLDGFEVQFSRFIQKELFERQRKSPR
jgi:peroxiredoxin